VDEDTQAREREESKRLLYVALTRARDRLYLSATVQNGQCRMTRGSLGEVLPASAKALFVTAALNVGEITWLGHTVLVPGPAASARQLTPTAVTAELVDDFGRL
jgi:ATP-dependent exoDNAse (exonuclease V) beta subunit